MSYIRLKTNNVRYGIPEEKRYILNTEYDHERNWENRNYARPHSLNSPLNIYRYGLWPCITVCVASVVCVSISHYQETIWPHTLHMSVPFQFTAHFTVVGIIFCIMTTNYWNSYLSQEKENTIVWISWIIIYPVQIKLVFIWHTNQQLYISDTAICIS